MNTNNQFQLTLPDSWSDRTAHLFQGPDDSGVQHNLQLVIEPDTDAADAAEYGRDRFDSLMESIQGATVLKQEEKTLSDGRTVYECVYKWIPVDSQVMFNKVVYMIVDGAGYTFTANFSKKTIKTIGVEVDRIIESFHPGVDKDEE
jgi:hypothetical protein